MPKSQVRRAAAPNVKSKPAPRIQSSDAKWLRLPTVEDRTGQTKSKIYALIAGGRFPPPIKIDGVSVWRASDVDAWDPAL